MKTKKLKTSLIIIALICSFILNSKAQDYKFITTVESVISAGAGRSRMIISEDNNEMTEIELKNFFSLVGIQFGNIKNNDQLIANKLVEQEKKGYKLINVSTGVYSAKDSQGIFITRYLFRKD